MNYRPIISLFQGLFAFTGVCVAGYVHIEKMRNHDVPCILGYTGCTLVTNSSYSQLGPIDVTTLGIAGYVLLLFLSVIKGTGETEKLTTNIARFMALMTTFGVCYSWYLQYVAHFILGAFCIWCRISAIDMTVLFALCILDLALPRKHLAIVTPSDTATTS